MTLSECELVFSLSSTSWIWSSCSTWNWLCMIVAKGGNISFGSIGTCTGFHQNFVFCVWQQPRPVQCASCDASGSKDCVWCKGTGFFFLGDQMLCEVPSRNTLCVICGGKVWCAILFLWFPFLLVMAPWATDLCLAKTSYMSIYQASAAMSFLIFFYVTS